MCDSVCVFVVEREIVCENVCERGCVRECV